MARGASGEADAAARDWEAPLIAAVSRVQRLVSEQVAPELIHQAVVQGATGLLAGDSGALRFVDRDDPAWMVAVASQPAPGPGERWRQRSPISEGVSGRTIATGTMVAVEGQSQTESASRMAPPGTHAVMGVPIRERGQVVGALVVGSQTPGRRWTRRDRDLLAAYAQHVAVAVAVARASHGALQAYTDPLTGLGNRVLLLDRLEHRLAHAHRSGRPVAVLFVDLDRFKLVNDSLGHIVGDQLLIAVAERLERCVRDGDVCARLGGDEFAVLLAESSDPDAVARRMISELQSRFVVNGHEVFIGVSIGIATGHAEGDTLVRNADVAMYHAKRAGTGRYEHFQPSMHTALLTRLGLDSELRRAVERAEFELHFQPLFNLRSGTIAAFECLVRWRHPVRGLISPLEFIPVAEETGLIVEIDRWVLLAACRRFAQWWREAPLSVCVNTSMRDLQQPDFAAQVERAIDGAFPPSALILEVTESARLEDAPGALASLHAVKELGVRVALDDFGTGYSSLLSLSQLPVDLLKIARPFLQALGPGEPKADGLLAGMVALGRHLGLMTVAEGIETAGQHELLVDLGCDLGQGFLLGRPLDADGASELVHRAAVD
ncbi:MAG TPA: EAL domain-containing protein [Solirubrobacteraceae bacterium]|nr:EAL domain-containing protein [Solirubrobacteraceae bacterium]